MNSPNAIGLALTLGLFALVSSTAHADVRTEARSHFRRGMAFIEEGDLRAGVIELQEAYVILPHPNVLYNIGRVYAELGEYQAAIDTFREYAASNPEGRDEIEPLIAQLEAQRTQSTSNDRSDATVPVVVESTSVTEQQITQLEAAANQLSRLAEATDSTSLRQRSNEMRALAEALRSPATSTSDNQTSDSQDPPDTAHGIPSGDSTTRGPDAPATNLALATSNQQDTYEEQVVSASRFAESPLDAPNSTTIVTSQDIRLTGLTSIPELLRRAAGVEVMTLAPSHSDVSVRGMNQRMANKVLVLINGRSVNLDFLGTTVWSGLPISVEDIDRIEIIRGPASALYGADAFSGVINIILKAHGDGGSYADASYGNRDTVRGVFGMTGQDEHFGYRFGGGHQQTDQYALEIPANRLDLGTYSDTPDNALRQTWFDGDLTYDFGNATSLNAGTAVSLMDYSFYGLGRTRQLRAENTVLAQSHASLSTPIGLAVNFYWNYFRTDASTVEDVPGGLPVAIPNLRQNIADLEVSWSRQFHWGFEHNFSIGSTYRFKGIDWSWLDRSHTENHFAAYIQDTMQITDWMRLQLSFRVDRHPLLSGVQFSPRGALVFRPADGQAIRVTVGTAFRSPTFLESYLAFENPTSVRGVTALGLGNTNLNAEHMTSFELGYANQATDWMALEANLYFNLVDNQIVLSTIDSFTLQDFANDSASYLDEFAAFPVGQLQFDNESARFRQLGGELGVRFFPADGLDLYANYAVHDTSPTDSSTLTGDRALDQRTPRHKLNLGLQYRSAFGIDASVDFHYASSQTWVEQVTDAETGVGFKAFPLSGFGLLNARLGYRFAHDQVELGIVGTNLLFNRHREHPFGQPVDTRVTGTARLRF